MKKNYFKNISGLTLVEVMIGVVITALMMGAMFTTYSVVNNSYSKVTDRAKISRSSRDLIGMMLKDIRLAGFRYYYGDNDEGIPVSDNLSVISGLEEDRTIPESHDPLIVERDVLGYSTSDTQEENITLEAKHENTLCCDRIRIVFGDFDESDPDQKYKRYRVTYYAKPMIDKQDKFYAVYKAKESWIENIAFPVGAWTSKCPECYTDQLVRSYLVDMEFLVFDENGIDLFDSSTNTYPQPDNDSRVNLYKIRQVDVRLTFRSKNEFYNTEAPENKPRLVKGLGDRSEEFFDKYLRDSVVVSIYTRNIGG